MKWVGDMNYPFGLSFLRMSADFYRFVTSLTVKVLTSVCTITHCGSLVGVLNSFIKNVKVENIYIKMTFFLQPSGEPSHGQPSEDSSTSGSEVSFFFRNLFRNIFELSREKKELSIV